MKRLCFILLEGFLISLLLGFASTANGANPLKIKANVQFNQLVYQPNDTLNINVDITPSVDLSDTRTSLKIGEKDNYVYSRTYYIGKLKKNIRKTIVFNKQKAKNFGLKFGLNLIQLTISEKQKKIYSFKTKLGLREENPNKKINFGLALNITDKPHLNAEKNLNDEVVQKKILPVLEKYEPLSSKYKGHINFIFNPLLAESINIISKGYNIKRDNKLQFMPMNSPSSKKARSLLSQYKKMFKTKEANLIQTSYSNTNAKYLPVSDFKDQFLESKHVLENIFDRQIKAHYSPGGTLFKNQTIKGNTPLWLAKNVSKKMSFIETTKPIFKKNKNKQVAAMEAFAYLAKAYNNNKKNLLLITSNLPSPSTISYFIEEAKKQNWTNIKKLSDLKPVKIKNTFKQIKPKRRNKSLADARNRYYILREAILKNSTNTDFDLAKMNILLAEDLNTNDSQSIKMANNANEILKKELSKIILDLSPLILTEREGKIPIKVINNTNTAFKLYLVLKTKGLKAKTPKKPVIINPKENLLSIPVTVIKNGRHKVLVRLKTSNHILTEKKFLVSTNLPSIFWYYMSSALALLALLILGAFYVRNRRSKASTTS